MNTFQTKKTVFHNWRNGEFQNFFRYVKAGVQLFANYQNANLYQDLIQNFGI